MKNILIVAIGGAIGTVARYLIYKLVNVHYYSTFILSTFIINVTGCFLLGIFYAAAVKHTFHETTSLFLIVGICGGFTTFSTFAFENHTLIKTGNYWIFLAYSAASIISGLLAVVAGMSVIR